MSDSPKFGIEEIQELFNRQFDWVKGDLDVKKCEAFQDFFANSKIIDKFEQLNCSLNDEVVTGLWNNYITKLEETLNESDVVKEMKKMDNIIDQIKDMSQ